MRAPRTLHLNTNITGTGRHPAGWRTLDNAKSIIDLQFFTEIAQTAERGKLDAVFLSDAVALSGHAHGPAQSLEPTVLLTALAGVTQHIGLIGTASTTFNDPYNLARRFASVDHLSAGRVAWNAVTTYDPNAAANFSMSGPPDKAARYARAEEFVDVVLKLWDSWEDDAFIRDKDTGIFYDDSKLHVPNHKGKHFSVRGPLNSARTPQGRPIIVQAGAAEAGREIAAKSADVVYSASFDISSAKKYYVDLKGRLKKHGRTADQLLIMPGLTTYVGRTRQEAQDKYDQLQELIDPLSGLSVLYSTLGDLSAYDLDGPVPDVASGPVSSIGQSLLEIARRDNLTIRQLYKLRASGGRQLIGTAADIVDDMEMWFKEGAADGFNLCPAVLPNSLDDFVELILPELRKRGLFRTEYASSTLRGNLGLKPLRFGD